MILNGSVLLGSLVARMKRINRESYMSDSLYLGTLKLLTLHHRYTASQSTLDMELPFKGTYKR